MDEFDVLPAMDGAAFPYLSDSQLLEGRAERLLAGERPGEGSPEGIAELADLVAALRGPARPEELAGQELAVAAFTAAHVVKEKAAAKEKTLAKEKLVAGRDNVRHLPTHFGPKVAAATAVALLAFTGVAAAAVTGTLPSSLQAFVHARISSVAGPGTAHLHAGSGAVRGAKTPPVSSTPRPTSQGPGPSAAPGSSATAVAASRAGACHAFGTAKSAGDQASSSPAARSLQAAAAAAGQTVTEYCAPYLNGGKPTKTTHAKPKTSMPSKGKPSPSQRAGNNGGGQNKGPSASSSANSGQGKS
jgi:hypothetical protein